MNGLSKITLVSALSVLTAVLPTHAQEKKLQRSDLPAAVQKTVDEQSKGATIKGFSTEVEDGKKIYEVQLTVSGHSKDISMDPQGHILEIEEEIGLETLPLTVKDGLMKAV